MFLLLTRVLLWLLIGTIFYYLLLRVIPKKYLTWFGGLVFFIFVVLAFINPVQSGLVADAWSILSFPLRPLGLTIVLLMIALRKGVKSVTGNQVMAALIILVLSSLPIVSLSLAQQAQRGAIRVEQQPRPVQTQTAQRAGAIVVLARESKQTNLPLSDTSGRLNYAAKLYRQQSSFGNPPLVIVSSNDDPDEITRQLQRAGVPDSQIVLEQKSADMHATAEQVAQIMKNRGFANRRIIVVSPALTSRRAAGVFAQVGIDAVPRSTDFFTTIGGAASSVRVQDFIPNEQALSVTTRVVDEFLTSLYYFLRGWQSPTTT